MKLTYKRFGWDKGLASLPALSPLKRLVGEQNRLARIAKQSTVTAVEKAIAEQPGVEHTLAPSTTSSPGIAIDHVTVNGVSVSSPEPSEFEKRAAALNSVFGIWKDRQDAPEDGLAYQQEMRAEWR